MLILLLSVILFSQVVLFLTRIKPDLSNIVTRCTLLSQCLLFVVLCGYLVLFYFRNINFGIDTQAYLVEFGKFCTEADYSNQDKTYEFTLL